MENRFFKLQISAKKIPKADILGHSDPYCKIFINGYMFLRTENHANVDEAEWDRILVGISKHRFIKE